MGILPDFDEATERKYLVSLTELLLESAFDEKRNFYYASMSHGVPVGQFLRRVNAVKFDGSTMTLKQPPKNVLKKLETLPLHELPLLVDTLDVAFTYFNHAGGVPNQIRMDQYTKFDPQIAKILQELGLLSSQSYLSGPLQLFMINHFNFGPKVEDWGSDILVKIARLSRTTWDDAPEEFRDLFSNANDQPPKLALGYLGRKWRYGHWLSEQEQARTLNRDHHRLRDIVWESLANPDHCVWAPQAGHQYRLVD